MAISDHTSSEVWYPVPSAPGFELSSEFRVRRHVTVGGNPTPDGPRPVTVHERGEGGYRYFKVNGGMIQLHRAVMEVAIGRPLERSEMVLHDDDRRSNNYPSNLKIGDRAQNVADARRNGRYAERPTPNPVGLDDENVREARRRFANYETISHLAREYGVHRDTMYRAISGKTFAYILDPPGIVGEWH